MKLVVASLEGESDKINWIDNDGANKQFVCLEQALNSLLTLYKLEVQPIFSTPSHGLSTNVSIYLESLNCNSANKISCSLIGEGK